MVRVEGVGQIAGNWVRMAGAGSGAGDICLRFRG